MQVCPTHWNALKAALDEAGLAPLIDLSPTRLDTLIAAGEDAPFDALWSAHQIIYEGAVRAFGPGFIHPTDDGLHLCPLCRAEAGGMPDWIEQATGSVLKYARQHRLLAPLNA